MGFLNKLLNEPEMEEMNEAEYLEIDENDSPNHGKFMIRVENTF